MGMRKGGQKAPDRHPGLDGQTDMPEWVQSPYSPSPQVNAKCDVVTKLSVFGTVYRHTHKTKPIHLRDAGCNYYHPLQQAWRVS